MHSKKAAYAALFIGTLMVAGLAFTALANTPQAAQDVTFFERMGLRAELMFAGVWGALASLALLEKPAMFGNWQAIAATTARRVMVAIVSAIMAAYMSPVLGDVAIYALSAVVSERVHVALESSKQSFVLFSAFIVGAGARVLLQVMIRRYVQTVESATPKTHSE